MTPSRVPDGEEETVEDVGAEDPFVGELVDWRRAGHRMRRSALVLSAVSLLAWLVRGLMADGPRLADLPPWLLVVLGGMFAVEVVVVGGAALRGMLRAGERGERLAGDDVAILPPQLRRR